MTMPTTITPVPTQSSGLSRQHTIRSQSEVGVVWRAPPEDVESANLPMNELRQELKTAPWASTGQVDPEDIVEWSVTFR